MLTPAQRFQQPLELFDRLRDLHSKKAQGNVIPEDRDQKEL
jgi:hypothetical protein